MKCPLCGKYVYTHADLLNRKYVAYPCKCDSYAFAKEIERLKPFEDRNNKALEFGKQNFSWIKDIPYLLTVEKATELKEILEGSQ